MRERSKDVLSRRGSGKTTIFPVFFSTTNATPNMFKSKSGFLSGTMCFLGRTAFCGSYGCCNKGHFICKSATLRAKIGERWVVFSTALITFPSICFPIPSDHRIVPKKPSEFSNGKASLPKSNTINKNQFVTCCNIKIKSPIANAKK